MNNIEEPIKTGASFSFGDALRSETLLLALAPVAGAYITFIYEAGYLSFFGVPIEFMQLDLVRTLSATFSVAIFFILWSYFGAFLLVLIKRRSPVQRALIRPFLFLFIFFPIAVLAGNRVVWVGVLITFSFLAALPFLKALRARRHTRRYISVLEEDLDGELKSSAVLTLRDRLEFVLFAIALCTSLFFYFGFYQSSTTKHFMTRTDQPSQLLVRSYGDNLIFVSYIHDQRKLGDEIILVKLGESHPVHLKMVVTGMLERSNAASVNYPFPEQSRN
jgi:hypothetical protein